MVTPLTEYHFYNAVLHRHTDFDTLFDKDVA